MPQTARQDIRLFGVTFATIFIAELGDKTQLATLGFAINSPQNRLIVLVAAAAALIASSLVGTLLGALLARFLRPSLMNRIAGIIFIACAALFLWQFIASLTADAPPTADAAQAANIARGSPWEIFAAVFAALFIAETGDKTQLATLSLAAGNRHARWIVFAGSAAALVLSTVVAVSAGSLLGEYFDQKYLTLAAAVVFAVLGIFFLIGRGEKAPREYGWLIDEIDRIYLDSQCRNCPDFMEFLLHIRELGSTTVNQHIAPLILPPDQWDKTCSGTCRIYQTHARLHRRQGQPPPPPPPAPPTENSGDNSPSAEKGQGEA